MKVEFDVLPVSGKDKLIVKVDGNVRIEWDYNDGNVSTNQWHQIPKLIYDAYMTGIHDNELELTNHGIRL